MDTTDPLRTIGLYLLGGMGLSLLLALLLLLYIGLTIKRLDIPPDANFRETLLLTPLVVVLMIDLLDLGLDFLAAPFAWIILDRLGLKALRNISAIEALIPLTQPIPTLTLSWLGVRLFKTNK